ncbi:MAG: ParA family protein [Bacteroidetes bacterium]|nr:MAG: ParA family protein [Bacteroidota bacterium]
MGKIIAIANQKGGVGKTTTAINLSASMAALEYKTLIIDSDPQANTTSGLGFDPHKVQKSIYECMINGFSVKDTIQETQFEDLYLIPSHINLVGAELEMIDIKNREYRMQEALKEVKNMFDFIFIDCSPSLGLINVNVMNAADSILIPVQCEYFAMEGLGKLLSTIKIVQGKLNKNLQIEGILMTMHDSRLLHSNQVVQDIRTHFADMVFETLIPRNIRISEAPSFGVPVIAHDEKSKGSVSYLNLAKELLKRNKIKKSAIKTVKA